MSEAAKLLDVIRRLINDQVLPAEQVMPDAPWQIRADDLRTETVTAALARKHRPCRNDAQSQIPMFIEVSEGDTQ